MVIISSIIDFRQSPFNLSPEQRSFASPFTNFSDVTFHLRCTDFALRCDRLKAEFQQANFRAF
jgi:hypothetical protein